MKRLPPLPDKREIAIWRPFGTNSLEPSSSSTFSEEENNTLGESLYERPFSHEY